MRLNVLSIAALALLAGLGAALAQTSDKVRAPRELPPASFTGEQYVDSRGCVFMRAGADGQTIWVPRIARDRTPLCGYPPTFGATQAVTIDLATRSAPATAASRGKIGCFTDSPVAERFRVVGGGTVVMCTRGDGNLATARAPWDLSGAAGTSPGKESRLPPVVSPTPDYRNPPKGFKRAWDDDRLNPNRAIGTPEGWAAQDQIWTRETPARLVADSAKR